MKKFLGFLLVIVLGAGTYFYIYNNPQRKALRAVQTAAEQGDADAQLALGKIYISGQGVPPSAQTAAAAVSGRFSEWKGSAMTQAMSMSAAKQSAVSPCS